MKIREEAERARRFLEVDLWEDRPAGRWLVGHAMGLLRFAIMTAEGFVKDRLLLQASALAYFTVLSLIPVVAIVIGIAAAIGVDTAFVDDFVETLLAGAPEAQERVLEQIRGAQFKALGGLGAAFLFTMTVLGISNIERAFNTIWGVEKQRSLARRFPDYLAILAVIPLLAAGLSLATGLQSQWLLQRLFELDSFTLLYEIGLRQVPWVVMSAAFALMFWFLPNTRVKFTSAALGGIVSGALVLVAQKAYVGYSVGVARADVLFGAFAQLPLLFVWIYIFWAIVLFGAEIAFAYQNVGSYRREIQGRGASAAERDAVALCIAIEVARAFRSGAPPPTTGELADWLGTPVRTVRNVIGNLERGGIVAELASEEAEQFQLGRSADQIRVADILMAVRGRREPIGDHDAAYAVERLLSSLDQRALEGSAGDTLLEVLGRVGERSEGDRSEGDASMALSEAHSLDRSAARG